MQILPVATKRFIINSSQQKQLFDAAFSQIRDGHPQEALQRCVSALEQFPQDANLICLAGQACLMLKDLSAAEKFVLQALEIYPSFANAHELQGDLRLLQGNFDGATASYTKVKELSPERHHIDKKLQKVEEIAQSQPNEAGSAVDFTFAAELEQAAKFKEDKKPQRAEEIYRQILRRNPNHSEAMRLLAGIAAGQNQYADAEQLLKYAVEKSPNFARAWLDLSKIQLDMGNYPSAIQSAEKLTSLAPEVAESFVALANAQAQSNQHDAAIESYHSALKVSPNHRGAFSGLAHQLKTIGNQTEALAVHRRNIAANPTNSEPYWNMANLKTFRFEQSEVDAMEALLETPDLDDLSIVQLSNALGLEYESQKDFDRAFSNFRRCNDTRRGSENYDPVGHEVLIDQLIEVFNEDFIAEQQGQGDPDPSPILIVGLPRSGSTLIEQILASHSIVEGTHELSDLAQMVQTLKRRNARGLHFPENMREAGQLSWAEIGQDYLKRAAKYRTDKPRFIDKNPNNFIYAGLLHLTLPNAKIINAIRHPLDSCFGSYKQLFASGQPFSYDLIEVGEYYLQYQRLIDHWHKVIPGKVLDVHYENVVADLDTQVHRILDFCELPFEESCLRFHETNRAVRTASSEQVRQPIYSSSINLWKNYEPYLGDLIEVLEPLLLDLPKSDQPNNIPRP